jgi:hypothetical protein
MDTGLMIAVQLIGLYVILGPLVVLGLYILFDRLAESEPQSNKRVRNLDSDPALWNSNHVRAYFDQKEKYSSLANGD